MSLDPLKVSSEGDTRDNFVNTHMRTAKMFARDVHEIEAAHPTNELGPHFDRITSLSIATVFSSVGTIEAFVGEIQFDHSNTFPGKGQVALEEFKRTARWSLDQRLDSLAALNGRTPIPRGSGIGQDFSSLVTLRNALVHFVPEWPSAASEHAHVASAIRGRFTPTRYIPNNELIFPRRWASYSCCKWAIETAETYVRAFAAENGWACSLVYDLLP